MLSQYTLSTLFTGTVKNLGLATAVSLFLWELGALKYEKRKSGNRKKDDEYKLENDQNIEHIQYIVKFKPSYALNKLYLLFQKGFTKLGVMCAKVYDRVLYFSKNFWKYFNEMFVDVTQTMYNLVSPMLKILTTPFDFVASYKNEVDELAKSYPKTYKFLQYVLFYGLPTLGVYLTYKYCPYLRLKFDAFVN